MSKRQNKPNPMAGVMSPAVVGIVDSPAALRAAGRLRRKQGRSAGVWALGPGATKLRAAWRRQPRERTRQAGQPALEEVPEGLAADVVVDSVAVHKVHGHVQSIFHVPLESKPGLEHKRQRAAPAPQRAGKGGREREGGRQAAWVGRSLSRGKRAACCVLRCRRAGGRACRCRRRSRRGCASSGSRWGGPP